MTADCGPRVEALAPVWTRALEQRGVRTAIELALWRDTKRSTPAKADQDMLEKWAAGEAQISQYAASRGVAHSRIQAILTDTLLTLLTPHLDDVRRWAQARVSGLSDEVIASLSGLPGHVVTLALDGWPASGHRTTDRVVAAHELWRDGASHGEVAAKLGMSRARLVRDIEGGRSGLTPRRLSPREFRARFGWTESGFTLYVREGDLPPPDGREAHRRWWWEATVDEWERARDLLWCPQCRHAFLHPKGLSGHLTTAHNSDTR